MTRIRIRNKEELRLLGGHLWAFNNELLDMPKDVPAGTIVTLVRERDGSTIGSGFYHPHSLIAFRLLTRDAEEKIDATFFEQRIREAVERRTLLAARRNAFRLVHGESDWLPGLIIDKYDDVISVQIVSAGFEAWKETIIEILQQLFRPKSIVAKNNSHLRSLEGLSLGESLIFGEDATTEIHDAVGTRFSINVLTGQKTGFYLDQMENRARLRDFIRPGMRVLDLFANDGGFAINAALAGAASVVAVDESATALERLGRNAELNGVRKKITTIHTDCFEFLRECREEYDVIVLDPPALAKSKKDIPNARKGYLALNAASLRLVRRNGILLTCSCSHHIPRALLLEIIWESTRRAKRVTTILEARGAGIDHPLLTSMPESEYLKVFILGVQ